MSEQHASPRPLPEVTDRDVYITRNFAAPIALVWDFWTKPELLAQWFGPHGISVDASTVAVGTGVGGTWNIEMHDDNGVYPISAEILVMDAPTYLEVRMEAQTEHGALDDIIMRIQFHDHGDTTRLTLHQGPFDADARDLTIDGWTQSFEKLDAIIAVG